MMCRSMLRFLKRLFMEDGFDTDGGYCYYDIFGNVRNSWGDIIIRRKDIK